MKIRLNNYLFIVSCLIFFQVLVYTKKSLFFIYWSEFLHLLYLAVAFIFFGMHFMGFLKHKFQNTNVLFLIPIAVSVFLKMGIFIFHSVFFNNDVNHTLAEMVLGVILAVNVLLYFYIRRLCVLSA